VERSEAEAIYAAGREPVISALVALSARLEAQDAQLAALSERVEELEQRLKRDSHNSSLPPSHDPPWLGSKLKVDADGVAGTRTDGRFGFTRLLLRLEVETDPAEEAQARQLAERAEQTCLVSASLDLPVETLIEVK
jgi:Family of unknown function (DUF6444)/OsmC-like protein